MHTVFELIIQDTKITLKGESYMTPDSDNQRDEIGTLSNKCRLEQAIDIKNIDI